MVESDLESLVNRLENMLVRFPITRREILNQAGDLISRNVLENIQTRTTKRTGNLIKAVQTHKGSGGGYVAVRNHHSTAPHAHLVENGHDIYVNGENIGKRTRAFQMYTDAKKDTAAELERMAEDAMRNLIGDTLR